MIMYIYPRSGKNSFKLLAYVASVSIWFRRKERPVLASREMKREPKNSTCAIFRAVFDSRSSFFAPKPRGNACYGGYQIAFWSDSVMTIGSTLPKLDALSNRRSLLSLVRRMKSLTFGLSLTL